MVSLILVFTDLEFISRHGVAPRKPDSQLHYLMLRWSANE